MSSSVANDFKFNYPERLVDKVIEPGLIVLGDKNLLRAALDDLFSNAWKFTSRQKQARIEFGCQKTDSKLASFVRDNGMVFDMEYAAKLLHHLHGNSEIEESGTGLAIVQRIIQKHGGTIWTEAQTDQGATFYFTLSPY